MAERVHLRTLGCRLNQSEIDSMARQFSAQGYEVVDGPELADQIIVNTCAVTEDAVRSSRQLVRQLNRANANARITVTGCYAQLQPDAINVLPGVTTVVSNLHKDSLVETITGQSVEPFDAEPLQRQSPSWMHRTRAFIKVQDGCDNACTFCVTTIARGEGRSRTRDSILNEVRMLLALGYQEVVLTGVHLGSYGHDRGERNGLFDLVGALLDETNAPRIRLSSLEPWDLTPEFFALWSDKRLCPHLHLPLQSGCDATLRRMLRRTTQREFAALVACAREQIEDVSITTDVIVGFPGETDAEFAVSRTFIEVMDFSGLHVFRYSKRPDTAAARMRGHVPEATKKERSAALITYSDDQERRFHERFVGRKLDVLWENVAGSTEDGFVNVGYTQNYLRVMCVHPRPLTNLCIPAHLIAYDPARRQLTAEPVL